MGLPRTLGVVTVIAGTPVPAVLAAAGYSPSPLTASSYSISGGIATIVFGSPLPAGFYGGPQGYAKVASPVGTGGSCGGQQVTLWGFTTGTYFNGLKVSVIDQPTPSSFRFYINYANVGSTSDTGKAAASPFQHYRAVRIEISQSDGTDFVYVGDLNVSSSRYVAALSLAGQSSMEIAGENIPPEGIFIDGTSDGDTVQVSLIY
jgi:hypothetical protein